MGVTSSTETFQSHNGFGVHHNVCHSYRKASSSYKRLPCSVREHNDQVMIKLFLEMNIFLQTSTSVLFQSCWNKDPNNRPSMEQVVKEISHLFQFFPDEIPPLEYPNPIDLIDAGGKNANDKSLCYLYNLRHVK